MVRVHSRQDAIPGEAATLAISMEIKHLKRAEQSSFAWWPSVRTFMSDILNKTIVLVLNRNWQAINIRTPAEAFCQMVTNVATALEIDGRNHIRS